MARPKFLVTTLALCITTVRASEVGHFAPGVLNIRDFAVPAPGYYLVVYNYGYAADRLTGYDSWQVTDDSGSDATNPAVKDQVHAAGAQVGLTVVPWNASFNFHYFYELEAKDRFQGESIGLNFAITF